MRVTQTIWSLLLLLGAAAATAADAPPIKITDAWIRGGPASAKVMAAYLTIENSAKTPDQITGMKSDAFAKIEAHRTAIQNGVARMVPVDPIDIPAEGVFKFEPNGTHIMLMGAAPSVKNAKAVNVQLTFKNAGTLNVDVPIKTSSETMNDHQH